jgi:glycosyltransferase involved in cell wall biosynthesis
MTKKLLVIIPDRLTELVQKGEVVHCYYNPGNVFDEIHIIMTNDDKPDPKLVQPMVGKAKLYLHNFVQPDHFFRNTIGWQFSLMQAWVNKFLLLVSGIRPDLVRTHNNFLEGYLAFKLKKQLSIPYVTSLHGVWDVDGLKTLKSKVHRLFRKKIESITLKNADAVICVYSAIHDYAKRHGCKNPQLIHNFVGGDHITKKIAWDLSQPIKLITVNRQLLEKNPENIIRALRLLPYAIEYTIIGEGILHDHLKDLAKDLGSTKRVQFFRTMPNEEVCKLYSQCDFMVSNCHYKGISKTIIEAGLSGLPIIINRYNDGYMLEEYRGGWIKECDDTPEGYAAALDGLIKNAQERESLGRKALSITNQRFSPKLLENKVAEIYLSLLRKTP